MLPPGLQAGNIIKFPNVTDFVRDWNWPGQVDETTREKLIASNMTASISICSADETPLGSWYPQAIGFQPRYNVCVNTNADVISGNFSGCWMASYTVGGQRRVAHVYTMGGDPAKAAFVNEVYASRPMTCCFKPSWEPPAHKCFGIITSNNVGYSLGLIQTGNNFEIKYVRRAVPNTSRPA